MMYTSDHMMYTSDHMILTDSIKNVPASVKHVVIIKKHYLDKYSIVGVIAVFMDFTPVLSNKFIPSYYIMAMLNDGPVDR